MHFIDWCCRSGFDALWFGFFIVYILLLPGCVIGTVGATRFGRTPEAMQEEISKAGGKGGSSVVMTPLKTVDVDPMSDGIEMKRLDSYAAPASTPYMDFPPPQGAPPVPLNYPMPSANAPQYYT